MAAPGSTTAKLEFWLEMMRAGDGQVRQELIGHACERLRKLTRRMLRGYPLVRSWERATGLPAMATPTSLPSTAAPMANLQPVTGRLCQWNVATNLWILEGEVGLLPCVM